MAEAVKAIGFMLFAALVIAVVVGGLLITWLAVAIAVSLAGVAWLPVLYFTAMAQSLRTELAGVDDLDDCWLGRNLRTAWHADRERSYPHYFFGPVELDTRRVIGTAYRSVRSIISAVRELALRRLIEDGNPFTICVGTAMLAGLVLGSLGGSVVVAAILIFYVLVAAVCAAAAGLAVLGLRGLDKAMRLVKEIRLTCPICAESVRPYAAYKCPECGELHRDIRPGKRGILGRLCRCGCRLPTSLLWGASRLSAMCSECGAPLPPKFGKIQIIVLPFFGSVRAGKTQLMCMLALTLSALIERSGGSAEFADDTKEEMDRIREQLIGAGSPRPTVARIPEAFVLHLKLGLDERYIYFFDPAGELHYRTDSLDELRYLDKANTILFTADPLSAESIWAQLDAERQAVLSAIRADSAEVELAYELPREQMRRMGDKSRVKRLGFVVTKKDLLPAAETSTAAGGVVRDLVSSADGMDLGNLVREAERSFDDVGFFETAAILDESGDPDVSVEELAVWIMKSEGIALGGR